MIPLSIGEIAEIVGGRVEGSSDVLITGPAVLDSRRAEAGGLFVAFSGANSDGHDFASMAGAAGAVAVLGTRATALPTIVVEDAAAALQALAVDVVSRVRSSLTVVGITGSQGKTSTKDMLATVFSTVEPTASTVGNLNNELGVPLTMLRVDAATRYLVIEMGARHMGEIASYTNLVAPDVSIVLNVGVSHIGEFGSQDAITTAKGEIVEGLAPGGTAILNADDERVMSMRSRTAGSVLTFGLGAAADVRVESLTLDRLGRPSFTLRTATDSAHVALPLVGAHLALNAAAVAAAALAAGVPLEVSAAALATATLTKWRMELRELSLGALLVNDSYNANPHSTRAALDALAVIDGQRRIAVLGVMGELGSHSESEHRGVGEYAVDRADIVVAVGEPTRPLAEGAGDKAVFVADNAAAIVWLHDNLAAGDVVLVKASRGAHLDEVAAALV